MTSDNAFNNTNAISNAELERYLDNDLPEADAAAITAAIQSDPALAAQLDRIKNRDTIARLALTTAPTTPPAAPSVASLLARIALRLAVIASLTTAAFFLAINLWSLLNPARPTDRGGPIAHDIYPPGDATDTTAPHLAANDLHAVDLTTVPAHNLVVVEIKLAPRSRTPAEAEPASTTELRTPRRITRPAPASPPIRTATTPAPRAPAAAPSAREVINNLPPVQRLETALAWAIRGEQRTIAFETLRTLREDNSLPTELNAAAATLAARPELRGWIASYGLALGG